LLGVAVDKNAKLKKASLVEMGMDADKSRLTPNKTLCSELNAFFKLIGQLGDSVNILHDFKPAQVVVIGNENCGKSTLLEMICGMPLFPHNDGICTRMRIELRLRYAQESNLTQIRTYNMITKQFEGEAECVPTNATCTADAVREAMQRVMERLNGGGNGVCPDKMLIVDIESPSVPSLDLVDLPGLVTASAVGEPADMPTQTRAIAEKHIAEHSDHSIYLCVVPATAAPNTSSAMHLIQQKGVESKTLGVLSMCDKLFKGDQHKLADRLNQVGDSVQLNPNGYVAITNAPVQNCHGLSVTERLKRQRDAEEKWFNEEIDLPEQLRSRVTTPSLVNHLMELVLEFMKRTHIPNALKQLVSELDRLEKKNNELGLPELSCMQGPPFVLAKTRKQVLPIVNTLLGGIRATWSDILASQILLHMKQKVAVVISQHVNKRCAIIHGPAKLKEFGDDLSKTVTECASTLTQVIESVITKAMAIDNSAFKLVERFPQVVDNAINCASNICDGKRNDMLTQLQHCIEHHLCVPSGSLVMVHDNDMKCVSMKLEWMKLMGDLAHLVVVCSAEIFDVFFERMEAEVVNTTFCSTTVESCHHEREKLKNQQQKIREVLSGIVTMAPDLQKTLNDHDISIIQGPALHAALNMMCS